MNDFIDVWLVDTSNFLSITDQLQLYLSADELERVVSFKQKIHGDRHLICRANLRIILSKYLKISPEKIVFSYTEKGKPYVNTKNVYFNLSHTDNQVIYAISNYLIGVDIENITKKVNYEQLAQRFFCFSEYEIIKNAKPEDKPQIFYSFWTTKEAYLKAIGEGLSGGLNTLELNYNISKDTSTVITPEISNSWQIQSLKINNNYLANIMIKTVQTISLNCNVLSAQNIPHRPNFCITENGLRKF